MNKKNEEKIKEISDRIALLESKIKNNGKKESIKSSKSPKPFVSFKMKKSIILLLLFSFIILFAISLSELKSAPINMQSQKIETNKDSNWLTNEEAKNIVRLGRFDSQKNSDAFRKAQEGFDRAIEVSNRLVSAHKNYKEIIEGMYELLRKNGYSHDEAVKFIEDKVIEK